ncbi:MAG TPA: hypothetical protein VFZ65_22725 [Planctomycetota bacterium]|nr:hypothetical protein [Planctomycetota bacterium]
MKAWKFLLPIPVLAGLAMVPQDPPKPADPAADQTAITQLSELQYTNLQGTPTVVSARDVVEIRFLEDNEHVIRLELVYENGNYSLIDAQSFHLLRTGGFTREVKLVRTKRGGMRFPRLP